MKNVYDFLLSPGAVVTYNNQYFLLWNINETNKAQLITSAGKKFSGTPDVSKLTWVKTLPSVEYLNASYLVDKHNRIFSLASGNEVYSLKSKSQHHRNAILAQVTKSPIFKIQQNFEIGFISKTEMMLQMMDEIVLKSA
jgi:hypothetical protein